MTKMKKLCLNLGCGSTDYRESTDECQWINVDRSTAVKTDQCYDITTGLPHEDNSIEAIHAGCILEQLTSKEFLFVMNECHRVIKPNGVMTGYVPSTDPRVLHLDPMDLMFFQVDSFKYLVKNCDPPCWERFGKNYGFLPWSYHKVETNPAGIIYFSLIK